METNNKGIVGFVPLLLVAVVLMGLVSYISVTRIKGKVVLGETSSEVSENDLKTEESSLDSVGDLSLDELEGSGIEVETKDNPSAAAVKVESSIAPLYQPQSEASVETKGFSFSGFFDSLLKGLEGIIRGLR